MMPVKKSILVVGLFLLFASFHLQESEDFVGTYGNEPHQNKGFSITLNEDHSFVYRDYSFSESPVLCEGTWVVQNGKAFLQELTTQKGMVNTWKLENDGAAIKARKGLCWYRLCKN